MIILTLIYLSIVIELIVIIYCMLSNLNKQPEVLKRQHNQLNSGIMTAQMNIRPTNQKYNIVDDSEIQKMIAETDQMLKSSEPLQTLNQLRKLKELTKALKNRNINITLNINLGITYYQVGFLEEAYESFSHASAILRDSISKISMQRLKTSERILFQKINGKISLQTCILFSQMGKHQIALEHAKISCKIHYDLIYETLTALYIQLNSILAENQYKNPEPQINIVGQQNLLNNIAILSHLLKVTKDLKNNFFSKEKSSLLADEIQSSKRFGKVSNRLNIETLYEHLEDGDQKWIYKNKILDQIQLKQFPLKYFQQTLTTTKNYDIVQRITFLAISLYCFSTETRFIEKEKEGDIMEVLDSEHWLSTSLEIAYMFLPPQAPILNQILTVHDRFHGIDKQTIPQDKQVTGFFKVLRPLTKPKSVYSSKSPICSPILIRIQASKLTIDMSHQRQDSKQSSNSKKFIEIGNNNTIDIDLMAKNNKIRGLSGPKMFNFMQFTENSYKKPRVRIQTTTAKNNNQIKKSPFQSKTQQLRLNLTELNPKSQSIRPPSYDKNTATQQTIRVFSQRKKKVLSSRRKETSQELTHKNTLHLDGFQLVPTNSKRIQQNSQQYELFNKINNTHRMLEATKLHGNVFINNNINLFIAKQDQIIERVINKQKNNTSYNQKNRRQNLMNKRRSNQQQAYRLGGISQ